MRRDYGPVRGHCTCPPVSHMGSHSAVLRASMVSEEVCTRVDVDLTCSGPHNRSPGGRKKITLFSTARLSRYTVDIDPSVRGGGTRH